VVRQIETKPVEFCAPRRFRECMAGPEPELRGLESGYELLLRLPSEFRQRFCCRCGFVAFFCAGVVEQETWFQRRGSVLATSDSLARRSQFLAPSLQFGDSEADAPLRPPELEDLLFLRGREGVTDRFLPGGRRLGGFETRDRQL